MRCAFRNFTGFRFRGGLYGIYLFRSMGLIYKEVWEIIWILYGMLYVIYVIFFPAVLCADQSGRTQCRALAQSRNQESLLKKIYSWQLHTHNYHRYVRQNYDILVDKPFRVMQPVLPRFSDSFFSIVNS